MLDEIIEFLFIDLVEMSLYLKKVVYDFVKMSISIPVALITIFEDRDLLDE